MENKTQGCGFDIELKGIMNKCTKDEEYLAIPEGVVTVKPQAFSQLENVKTLYIPKSCKEINDFPSSTEKIELDPNNPYFCLVDGVLFTKDMKSIIYFPSNMEMISYNIPEGVETLHDCCFMLNKKLMFISIPKTVEKIEKNAFYGVRKLECMYVDQENKYFNAYHGVLYNKDLTTLIYYPAGILDDYFEIPHKVETIGAYAFNSNRYLMELDIPESVKTIGYCAFMGTEKLPKLIIPKSVKMIEGYAFSNSTLKYLIFYVDEKKDILNFDEESTSKMFNLRFVFCITKKGVESFDCNSESWTTLDMPQKQFEDEVLDTLYL